MKYGLLAAVVLFLAAVVLSAGCVGFPPAEDPLAGDPALGTWVGNRLITKIDSDTGEKVNISRSCMIKIREDGRCTMSYSHGEGEGPGIYRSFSGVVTVSKQDNFYIIDASSAGIFVMTLSEDGYVKMMTPYGSELYLQRGEA
ncbi:hypothetical protein [Methanorbis furvi]|uniref:Lipocalin-like domain-containing protein n=1 Tax=Methanorbis furvi TaxID=3028299 RepID=A0AAE4MA38_9EURY|nr:hypothetical protein [Methanocorpusculaceae archaeon Ag1]